MSDQKPGPSRAHAGSAVTREQHDAAADLISGQPRRRGGAPRGSSDLDLVRIEHEGEPRSSDALTPPVGPLPES